MVFVCPKNNPAFNPWNDLVKPVSRRNLGKSVMFDWSLTTISVRLPVMPVI